MQQILAKFGILQVARTGKISLKRGDQLLEMGGWGDGLRRRQHRKEAQPPQNDASASQNGSKAEDHQEGSDVYAVDNQQTGAQVSGTCKTAAAESISGTYLLHQSPWPCLHIVILVVMREGSNDHLRT